MRLDLTAQDLVAYRTLFAVTMLVSLPDFGFVSAYPDSTYTPPPGLMQLFDGFPPLWVLTGLELVLAVALAALLAGRATWPASILATAVMTLGYGFTYSLGKIDHNILLVLTPLALAWAGWSGRGDPRGWVLRWWAYTVGLAMLTAGWAKLTGGWLDPGTQATRGTVAVYEFTHGQAGVLAPGLLGVDSAWLWESLDVAAVVLECGLVLTVFSWRLFRIGLALLCLFHVGVWVVVGISFGWNVLAYGAFVAWRRVPVLDRAGPPALPLAAAAGLTAWAFANLVVGLEETTNIVLLITGALAAGWYAAWLVARGRSPRPAGRHSVNA